MDRQKTDFFGECNTGKAPIDVFLAEWCARCINPNCTRSLFGQSKFETRVNSWYDRLFANIPRMSPEDPNYEKISAQKFVAIEPSLGDVKSDWVDPLELGKTVETKRVPKSEVFSQPPRIKSRHKIIEEAKPEPVSEPKPETKVKSEPKQQLPDNLAFVNTPVKQGQIIEGKASKPKIDAWEAPISSNDTKGVRVIKPGEKIKLG